MTKEKNSSKEPKIRPPKTLSPGQCNALHAKLSTALPDNQQGQLDAYLKGVNALRQRLSDFGAIGYGLGIRQDYGRGLSLAFHIYVAEKHPIESIKPCKVVPRTIQGMRTDVVPIGSLLPLNGGGRIWPSSSIEDVGPTDSAYSMPTAMLKDLCARRSVMNPLQAGVSIGPDRQSSPEVDEFQWAGTLGAFVRFKGQPSGQVYLLSNNHVMAGWTRGGQTPPKTVPKGTAIGQPGVIDDPIRAKAGLLYDAVPIQLNDAGKPNYADVALAALAPGVDYRADVYGYGAPNGSYCDGPEGFYAYQTVLKAGRTTGMTLGLIADLDANFWLQWDEEQFAWFEGQLGVMGTAAQPYFSAPGDSGSLVIDYCSGAAAGLLFAGSESGMSFVSPMDKVLSAFGPGKELELAQS